MEQHVSTLILIALMNIFIMPSAIFADDNAIVFRITDTDGNVVEDAVITLIPDVATITPPPTTPAIMAQRDMTFVPHVLAIPKGTEVIFPNEDDFRHHIYSFSKARQFEIRLYGGDEEKRISFDFEGIVALGCNIHDSMLGYIYVAQSPYVMKSDGSGTLTFTAIPAGHYSIAIWHPRSKNKKTKQLSSIEIGSDSKVEKEISISLKKRRTKSRKKRY